MGRNCTENQARAGIWMLWGGLCLGTVCSAPFLVVLLHLGTSSAEAGSDPGWLRMKMLQRELRECLKHPGRSSPSSARA